MDIFRSTREYVTGVMSDTGKAGLSALFPNDYELYQIALELLDSDLKTIDYFSFPILPSDISVQEAQRITVKQTNDSIIVLRSQSYAPKSINIKGTFGRDLLILTKSNSEKVSAFGIQYKGTKKWEDVKDGSSKIKQFAQNLSPYIKTGFGCTKLLQSIIDKSKGVDSKGNSFVLVFYNLALNESYVVVPTEQPLTFSMDENSSNMMWRYDLNLTAIASANNLFTNETKNRLFGEKTKAAFISSGVKRLSTNIKKLIL